MILDIWPFQLCLVIGFGLMTVVGIFQLYQDVQQLRGKSVFKWAPEEEEIDDITQTTDKMTTVALTINNTGYATAYEPLIKWTLDNNLSINLSNTPPYQEIISKILIALIL